MDRTENCFWKLGWCLFLSCCLLPPSLGFAGSEFGVLEESVTQTLKTNPRLDVLKNNREAAKKDLRKAQGGYYPSLDARAGVGTDMHSDTVSRGGDYDHDWDGRQEYSLTLRQLLWDGWETRSFVGISRSKLDSVKHRVFDNAESLALDAVIAYLDVYRQKELVRFAEENLEAHTRILDSLQERQKLGAGSIADVRQTQGRLARAQASLAEARSGLEVAAANYRRVVGGEPPSELVLPVKPVGYVPDTLESALEIGRIGNPKLAAATSDIETARQNMEFSRSKLYPKFYAELGTSYEDGVESSKTWEHNTSAMLRMNWNLYNGGADTAEREAGMYRMRQTKADRNELSLLIDEEVEATWSQYLTAMSKMESYGQALEFNKDTLSMYMDQFNVGQRSLLDVLDAENELFQTSGLLVTARANEVIAAFRLLALGGKMTESLGIDPVLYTAAPATEN